ncbi:hypothetical protein EVG20_g7735 [Dentipellis fragilis]|uniref:Uncharacterized protein n=1 Tax=Dentipellis fragilis TaxID=205917 RepID=A0A4Y9YCZ3_9AGAM|nr:hypothetical protein EVG20_g7735 [Dentipellis fragilis]
MPACLSRGTRPWHTFVTSCGPSTDVFLRKKARKVDASRLEAERKQKQTHHDQQLMREKRQKEAVRRAKKAAADAVLASVQPCLDVNSIREGKWTVAELNLQLRWHRQHDPKIKIGGVKRQKLEALLQAVERFNEGQGVDVETKDTDAVMEPVTVTDPYDSDDPDEC